MCLRRSLHWIKVIGYEAMRAWPVRRALVIRWLFVIFLVLIVFASALPWLEKLGIGRLPGDLRFSIFGKKIFLPFASTILVSLLAFVVARFV